MNGITTLSSPQVNARPRKISSRVRAPRVRDSTGTGRMPNCCSARVASSLNGSTSWRIDLDLVAADGLQLAQRREQVEPGLHVRSRARWG